ncbi:FAD dependent oxidoreductase [Mrakia frigida]|uniref:NAD(P)/FAD-dependent oxidoreductase n=1 Tax=Mrakia frigida TaxID=29902 RepID=UPI003FCC103F
MSSWPQPFTSTVSHWQATNKGPKSLWNYGKESSLPKERVDIVIIGAGMTGASLAYQLTRPGAAGEGKTILLLEAKDVASGATGRNGGHLAPATSNAYPSLITPLSEGGAGVSSVEALKIIKSERENYELAKEICEKEGLVDEVDLYCGQGIGVFETESVKANQRAARKAWLDARAEQGLEEETESKWIEDPEEAKRISRTPTAIGAYLKPAGSVHPHKLCTALLRIALDPKTSSASSFELQTWTPVESITPLVGEGKEGWKVETVGSKGSVEAGMVVLCSNAHTGHLFGEADDDFKKHITPVRGHASLITTPPSFSGASGSLDYTYGFEGPYLVTAGGAGLVMGVGWGTCVGEGLGTKDEFIGVVDDSVVLEPVKEYLSGYLKKQLNWGDEAPGEGLTRIWTGIMGYSRDILPLVGPVPNQPNLWAAVAFHGHGMSRILSCTRSLAQQIQNQGIWDDRLPRSFEITTERFQRARGIQPMLPDGDNPGRREEGEGNEGGAFGL